SPGATGDASTAGPRVNSALVRAQQLGELVGRDRLAEVVALHLVASALAQEGLLLGRLDALGDDGQAERLAHRDDGLGDRLVFAVGGQLTDERAVDLQR